ncbi:hypothetical protein [Streptomyces sp. NRRL B-24484]|uniref:hypothetical protein n=1 Tax=Streptomyces sp. NRRL B-24484 TaxID=1463833 RepID=UPI0004C07A00|nr:hypothetical protein [Streptomyces sp. NRRL B-24484]
MAHADRDLAMLGENVEPAGALKPETLDRVRAVVTEHARDGDDRRLLLDALGLAGEEPAAHDGPADTTRTEDPESGGRPHPSH